MLFTAELSCDDDRRFPAAFADQEQASHSARPSYPQAQRLLITADSGGSHGSRVRLWKWELQKFADETRLAISVCHFPPGSSNRNKLEHRWFSFISQNWRGKPLLSHEVIIHLIAATTTKDRPRGEERTRPQQLYRRA